MENNHTFSQWDLPPSPFDRMVNFPSWVRGVTPKPKITVFAIAVPIFFLEMNGNSNWQHMNVSFFPDSI